MARAAARTGSKSRTRSIRPIDACRISFSFTAPVQRKSRQRIPCGDALVCWHNRHIARRIFTRRKERLKETDLAVLAGLAGSTVKNMFGGKTRRPAHTTFSKMAGALGYKYDLVHEATPDYESEIPKAREEFKQYRAQKAKKRQKKSGKGNGHKK